MLLKRCFTRINMCFCELIGCAGEESLGFYRQLSTVKHPQMLIALNYNSDKSSNTIVHVRMWCGFVCDAVDLFNSMFSIHTLVLVTFYSHYIYLWHINKACFVSVMGIMVTCTETVVNAAGFTVPIYVCSCTTAGKALYNCAFLINIYRTKQNQIKHG